MTTEDLIAKRIDDPDTARRFLDGSKRSVAVLNSAALGFGEYLPGWRWSQHARPQTGAQSERHVGYVLSGYFVIRGASGVEVTMGPGDAFEVGPGHDAWVKGDEPCIALDFTTIE